jgi:SAM-dependent methyltransferase
MKYGKEFFETYCSNGFHGKTIVDVGAQDVNGSLREFCPVGAKYIGVDFVEGKGVDIVLTDPYQLPFDAESVDVVVCSSVFEHSEFFWLLFLECIRILKPDGLFYLNVPSNGYVHRYPVDSWRFYPDAGHSLVNWSRRNSFDTLLLESFVAEKQGLITGDGMWNDFVAVVLKDEAYESNYPDRIFNKNRNYVCGYTSNGVNEFPLFVQNSDHKLILEQQSILVTLNQSIADRDSQIAERDTRIEGLAQALAERDTRIEGLTQALAERDTRIEGLTQALAEIHKSLIWRLTKPLRKGKDFAFTKF